MPPHWGPEPLTAAEMPAFVRRLKPDDVALSVAGYTHTDPEIGEAAIALAMRETFASSALGYAAS